MFFIYINNMYYMVSTKSKRHEKLMEAYTLKQAKAHAKFIANLSDDYKGGYKVTQILSTSE
jgi:hypothetical protein